MSRRPVRAAAAAAVLLMLGASLASANDPTAEWTVQPRLGHFDSALLDVLREEEAMARASGEPPEFEDHEKMEMGHQAYLQRQSQRGGTLDDDSCHYARGNTLVMHVFINHTGHTWSQAERDEAGGKASLAKDYYINNTILADQANMHFDNEGTTAYWYSEVTVPYEIEFDGFAEILMDEALFFMGVNDSDGDGARRDDYSLGLQFWNGGWDNVIVAFQPADLNGRAYASYHYASQAAFRDDHWTVWRHEWGHLFGACDEYVENGMCGGGIDCGSCGSEYLDQVYSNGNCELCGNDNCVMIDNVSDVCYFTQHHWGRADDDFNGQLNVVKRRIPPSTFVNIHEIWNNGTFTHFTDVEGFVAHVKEPAWAVFGLRSPSGSDYDMRLYLDNNHNYQMASSGYVNPTVDFIVGDYNLNRLGNEHLRMVRASGPLANYTTSWFNSGAELYPDGQVRSQNWVSGNIVRVWDVPLFGGETVSVNLNVTSGSGDYGMAMFRSVGTTYFTSRGGALWTRDANGNGGNEGWTFDVPADDVYGLVVWSNQNTTGTFTLQVGPTPTVLAEETPVASLSSLKLYRYTSPDPFWSVLAARPPVGGDVTLRLFADPEYQTHLGTSDDDPGVEFVARDHLETASGYLRLVEEVDAGLLLHNTEWEGGADLSTGYVTGNWTNQHVAKVWDVSLQGGQPYFFRQYHPTSPTATLDTGLYLMNRNGFDTVREKSNAVASSDFRAPSAGGEWFSYTPPGSGFHGLIQTMNNSAAGSYSLWHGPSLFLSSNVVRSEEVIFSTSLPLQPEWVAWGVRPQPGQTADAWIMDGSFGQTYAASVGGGTGTRILASDLHHTGLVAISQRYRRTSGTGNLELGTAVATTLPFTPGTVQTTNLNWAPGEVVKAFTVQISANIFVPRDFQLDLIDESGVMELGVAFFASSSSSYFGGEPDAEDLAEAIGPGGNSRIFYHAIRGDLYGVVVFNNNGATGPFRIETREGTPAVGAPDPAAAPDALELAVRSNPFRDATSLSLALPEPGSVRVAVYDVQGRLVRTLADRAWPAGVHRLAWDGRDEGGRAVAAGVYLARLEAGRETRTLKLVRVP